MRFAFTAGLSASLFTRAISAACSTLLIDDFSKFSQNTNSLGSWCSDDKSITGETTTGKVLSFKPSANSYFYETIPCLSATAQGFSAIQFTITGPVGATLDLELQTQASCSATTYTSFHYPVSGFTGSSQTITVPLSAYTGANLDAVTSFVWQGFTNTSATWKFSQVQFVCGASATSSGVSGSSSSSAAASSAVSSPSPSSVRSSTASSTSVTSSKASSNSVGPSGLLTSRTSVPSTSSSSIRSSSSSSSSSVRSSSSSSSSSSIRSSSSSSSSSSVRSSSSSSAAASSTSSSSRSSSVGFTTLTSASQPSGSCSPLLIDDFQSQSRLTFLFYNAMLQPSSDDATMTSVTVGQAGTNRVTLVSKSKNSYFYSQFGCPFKAKNVYGGITLRIKAAAGTTMNIQLTSGCGDNPTIITQSASQLGWSFDGTEKLYTVDFSKFNGLDTTQLQGILFGGMAARASVVLGPMAFYCGSSPAEYIVTATSASYGPSSTVPAPSGTAVATVIDNFKNKDSNALGFWHGADDGMKVTYNTAAGQLTLSSPDSDYAYYTQVSGGGCVDINKWNSAYLHIPYTGTTAFTISLQQHNDQCNDAILPYPATWDSLEAARYASATDIYIPLSHFNVDMSKIIGFSFHGFYKSDPVTFSKIEIVSSVPQGFTIPYKIPSGNLVFQCTRPNSFAFAIDDGSPEYAQQVMQIIKEENIKVTFFTVGAPLLDASTNLSNVYNEMISQGHQLALHSYTHPKMEGLPSYDAIDWEYNQDIAAVAKVFNGLHTPYFRPPFGNEGARMRQRLGTALGTDKFYIVNWSVDVQDWLWATSSTPEKQLDAFKQSVSQGGNLVVMHYLYPSTVGYLRDFIKMAKATGKQLMRVDQCMMDPNAPPL